MSVVGYACDHGKHRECGQRLGAVSMLNGHTAVLICDCACHQPTQEGTDQ